MTRYDIARMCGYNSVEEYDEDEKRNNEIFFGGLKKQKPYVEKEPIRIQPVKHGRWIGIYEYCEKNGYIPSGMGIYYWCSECDKAEQKTSDFCPNCGARIDLKDGDAE